MIMASCTAEMPSSHLPSCVPDQSSQELVLRHLPPCLPDQVSQELVDAMHKRFYDALEAMWAKHQPSFPEYADVKLVMV